MNDLLAWRRLHYEREKELAARIMEMGEDTPERRQLYQEAYRVLIKEVLDKYNPGGSETDGSDVAVRVAERLIGRGGKVLDVGCGSGVTVARLLERGFDAYGMDVEGHCVERAQERLQRAQERVFCGDVLECSLEGAYDLLIMDNTIEHLIPDTVERILRRCSDLLKPEGYVLIVTPHRFSGPHDISQYFLSLGSRAEGLHLREYSFGELEDALKTCGFAKVLGFPFHPKLLKRLGIVPSPSEWAARKAARMERWLEGSRLFRINKKLSRLAVALLCPAVCVGQKSLDQVSGDMK